MQIQSINNNYNNKIAHKAKFVDTYSMRKIAEWAKENGKYKELNEARKRIESTAFDTRIELILGKSLENDCPIAIFRRYVPKCELQEDSLNDKNYDISKPLAYQTRRQISPFEFGFERIIQMSNYIKYNKLFKEIVLGSKNAN